MTLDRPFRSFRQSRVIYDFYYLTSLDNLSFFRLCRFVFYRAADNHTSTHPVISRKWDSLWVRALEQRLYRCPGIPVRDAIHFHWTHPFLWLYYSRFSACFQFAESTKSRPQNWAKKRSYPPRLGAATFRRERSLDRSVDYRAGFSEASGETEPSRCRWQRKGRFRFRSRAFGGPSRKQARERHSRQGGLPPYGSVQVCGGIWGNGTFPLPVAEEGKVPFPKPRLWRAVA